MKLLIIAALFAMAFAQEASDIDASFEVTLEWPENDNATAGAIVQFAYADIGTGSCSVQLPLGQKLQLFHAMNAHIVPEATRPSEGRYMLAAPASWEAINGTINVLILFDFGGQFNLSLIQFSCDPTEEHDLSVYSFPQNNLQKEASSNVFYRPGFHIGDVLTITLQYDVARFNITGADSRWRIEQSGKTITVRNFQNEEGIDDQKEVHFSLDYGDTWFNAGNVAVEVQSEEEPEETGGA